MPQLVPYTRNSLALSLSGHSKTWFTSSLPTSMTSTPSLSAQCPRTLMPSSLPPSMKSLLFCMLGATNQHWTSWTTNAPKWLRSTSVPTGWRFNWSLHITIVWTPPNKPSELLNSAFKEHFIAALATIDNLCPLQLRNEFLPQVKLTLNLIRLSRRNPLISANHKLYSPFDFNKMPLAPLGNKALVYNDPATWTSWAPHVTDGFYVGPATDHYHCLQFYIPATQRFHFSNTWRLYPRHCQVPTTLEHNITLLAAANPLQQLGRAIPTMTTAKLKHLNTIWQLTTIMAGQPNVAPPNPTSPRVVPATPLRVAIAAPPRVATMLNTITAPNTIQ